MKMNLQLEISTSQEDQKNKALSKFSNNTLSFSSVEIKANQAKFKKEGFAVDEHGIKNVATGEELTKAINPKDLEIGDFLGSGASGSVHLASYKPTNTVLAVKSINLYDKGTRKQFKNDLKVLSDNKCENLIKFYGAFFSEGNVKILLEYMNLGSLESILKTIKSKNITQPCIPEPIIAKISYQILNGISYLHKIKHQLHRDIKPANILINTDGIVKLTDFGIAKSLNNTTDFSHTFIGSKNFMSPERISGKNYSYPSDVWSFGLVVYELVTGIYPFGAGDDFLEQITKIVEGPEPELDSNLYSKEFQDFIKLTLKKDPGERMSVSDLLNHPWIVNNKIKKDSVSEWLAVLFDYKIVDSK